MYQFWLFLSSQDKVPEEDDKILKHYCHGMVRLSGNPAFDAITQRIERQKQGNDEAEGIYYAFGNFVKVADEIRVLLTNCFAKNQNLKIELGFEKLKPRHYGWACVCRWCCCNRWHLIQSKTLCDAIQYNVSSWHFRFVVTFPTRHQAVVPPAHHRSVEGQGRQGGHTTTKKEVSKKIKNSFQMQIDLNTKSKFQFRFLYFYFN